MGRVSFRLRRDTSVSGETVNAGSFTRGGQQWQGIAGVGVSSQDNDRSIRARNLVLAFDVNEESFLEALSVDYTTNLIAWSVTTIPTTVSLITANESGLIGLKLVYSPTGYPEAADDGVTVYEEYNVDPSTGRNIANQSISHQTTPGAWGYYSLFGRYYQDIGGSAGSGSYWFEKLASVECLTPSDYGSSQLLWDRIPMYYRESDESGDLARLITVFGFEVDRTRSLIQSVIHGHDPLLAEAEGIEQLAKLVGLEVGVNDIGVTRTRALLHDIGFLRRRKGTTAGIIGYLKAISGADVDFVLDAGNYRATVYAQRANLIGDPRFVTLPSAGTPTWQVVFQNTAGTNVTQVDGGITITTGSTATKVAVVSKVIVPMTSTNKYYMSVSALPSTGVTIYGGRSMLSTTTWSTWTGWTAQDEPFVSGPDYDDSVLGTPVVRRVFDMTTSVTAGGNMYPVMLIDMPANSSITLMRWMLEPNRYGSYFDGSSDFGGFLYGQNFNDYAWSGGSSGVNNSYSTFVVQRAKTEAAIKKVCSYIIPATISFNPESSTNLRFDWIPGKT